MNTRQQKRRADATVGTVSECIDLLMHALGCAFCAPVGYALQTPENWWMGRDMLQFYPEDAHAIIRGEAVNTATTYGYDSVTMMQETKTTICQVEKFTA